VQYGADYSYGISSPLAFGAWSMPVFIGGKRFDVDMHCSQRVLSADAFWPEIYNLSGDALVRGDQDVACPSLFDNTVGYRHSDLEANVVFVDGHTEALAFDASAPGGGVHTHNTFVYYPGESVNEPAPDLPGLPRDYPDQISPVAISEIQPHGGWTRREVYWHKGWTGFP
jgi:prepilin-type processing-associated H-X9-DG protein